MTLYLLNKCECEDEGTDWKMCSEFQWNVRNIVKRAVVQSLKFRVVANEKFH